jgi:RNA polymerase sigma factor (sigma-70 family)
VTEQKYTEEELVILLQRRDRSAFSYLYDNYAGALMGVIAKLVADSGMAEDLLQEAFVKIWNNFSQYDAHKGRLFTWMLNLTRNLSIDALRSKGFKKQAQISSDENSVHHYSDNSYGAASFDAMGLRQQLLLLKPEQKVIVEMAYFSGYTQDEIAKELGIPLGTIKTRMRAAIMELRKRLQT